MEKQPKPGEFIGGEKIEHKPGELLGGEEIKNIEIKTESTERLVQSFNLFKDHFNPKADLIYYPCSGSDISIAKSFPESKIIFLDQHDGTIDALSKAGFEAVKESAQDFKLKVKADIMLLYNPQIPPSGTVMENLSEKGYFLCNDYHDTASLTKEREDLTLKAIIRNEKGNLIVDTENLEDYWKEIDSEEEFKNAPFSWGGVNYDMAKKVVEKRTGKTENILEEYKKIIAEAKEAIRKQNEKFFEENPDFPKNMMPDENSDPLMWKDGNGEQHFIIANLPKKKGVVDDTFVFYKKPKELINKIENIEIDEVEEIEKFCDAEILYKPQREKLDAVRGFLRDHLRNALNRNEKIPEDILKRIWDQDSIKKMSQVFQDKYGVCLDWHVVAHAVLGRLGIESVFRTGRIPNGPGHTYLDVKIDRKWEIFDPFAEKYLEDVGSKGTQFQDAYYKDSFTKKENS